MEPNNDKKEVLVEPYHDEGPINPNPVIDMKGHQWKQQGTAIVCVSCPLRHRFYIPVGVILKGINEEGLPILKKEF